MPCPSKWKYVYTTTNLSIAAILTSSWAEIRPRANNAKALTVTDTVVRNCYTGLYSAPTVSPTIEAGIDLTEKRKRQGYKTICADEHSAQPICINPRANGAERRSGRKPGARVLIPPGYLHPGKRKN